MSGDPVTSHRDVNRNRFDVAGEVTDGVSWYMRPLRPVVRFALRHWIRHDELVRVRQQLRYLAIQQLGALAESRPKDLEMHELSIFSQNGEDGVLQEIIRRLGPGQNYFLEIGAEYNEANCIFLADVMGWKGTFIDANAHAASQLAARYGALPHVRVFNRFITPQNISSLLQEGIPADLDVLSIDVDGDDYWLWQAVEGIQPRVVIIEYNSTLPADAQLVQPYGAKGTYNGNAFTGASIGALRNLAADKGYRLVHLEVTGTNAFFVRKDIIQDEELFPLEDEVKLRPPNLYLYGLLPVLPKSPRKRT